MQRVCPHCDYDMAGLPSDICPECGKRYDPALAASLQKRRRRSAEGVQLSDILLVLALIFALNAHQWQTLGWVALVSGAWAALRRRAIRRGPMALWLALVAIFAADALSQRGPMWLVVALLAAAAAIVVLEITRFGWRAPAAILKAAGLYLGIGATLVAMVALGRVLAGGAGSSFRILSIEIEPEGRLDYAVVLCVAVVLAALGYGLWRVGGWLGARATERDAP